MAALAALRYGSSLSDPAVNKNRQNLVNALIGLLGALAVFCPIEVTSDDIQIIAGGIAAVIGLYNIYVTTATSTKIGLPPKGGSADAGMQSNEGELPKPSEARTFPLDSP